MSDTSSPVPPPSTEAIPAIARGPRTVLITAASSGIGAATAREFCREGNTLFLHIFSNIGLAKALVEHAKSKGATAFIVPANFATEAGPQTLIDQVKQNTDKLDVLVNLAGSPPGFVILSLSLSLSFSILTNKLFTEGVSWDAGKGIGI